jgi:DNA-directed RNA polymerase specialized sigma24 family protein
LTPCHVGQLSEEVRCGVLTVYEDRDPEQEAVRRERHDRLHTAVGRLPFGLRQAMVLALEGLGQAEIGDVLGIRESEPPRVSRRLG